jgi:Flp pilus assembly protein TadG
MAEGQVIIDDDGTTTQGGKGDLSNPIAVERQEGGNLKEMDELKMGGAHQIQGVTLQNVTVSGSSPTSKDFPSNVTITGTEDGATVTVCVQNGRGFVQVEASEDLTEPETDIYTTVNVAQISSVNIDGQSTQTSGGTVVRLTYK